MGDSFYVSGVGVQFRLDCCHSLNIHVRLSIEEDKGEMTEWIVIGDTGPNVNYDTTLHTVN